ncbi:MAG: PIG-L family deacetylase [Acidobacteriota bacterium]
MTRRSASRPSSLLLLALTFAGLAGLAPALLTSQTVAPSALEPPATGGLTVVDRALAKLSTHRRLLVIAAHPDDEDTSLLTLVSRGMGGESAYLAMSRGEGGQNLIGPELGVGLGLIRSRELLAARGVDGGRQYFTRAFDFGYTRSLEETLRLWPKEALLEDTVRVIRRFKPQVVVSIFPGQPHPNHGQHQAAGVAAHEAFPLAGDPKALPQLADEGLLPWTPQALYRSGFFNPPPDAITLPIGGVDPLVGRSYVQIAMASRSQHRSQDMGLLLELGPRDTRVVPEAGAAVGAKELFSGIDTRLAGIASTVADPERRRHAADHLDSAQVLAERTRAALAPGKLGDAVPGFAEILKHLRAAEAYLDRPEERPVRELIAEKIDVAEAGLVAAAGIALDATTEREMLTAGEAFPVQAVLWNSGGREVAKADVELVPSAEWGGDPSTSAAQDAAPGALAKWDLQASVPAGAAVTTPYFLRKPMTGALYDWSAAAPAERGEPFGPAPLVARFSFAVDGLPVTIEREVVHRHRDQALGEIRRPIRVVPKVEVSVADELLVWPVARKEPRRLQVTLASHAAQAVQGRLEAKAGSGWAPVEPVPFSLEPGEEKVVEVAVRPAASLAPGRYRIELAAVLADGSRYDSAAPVIDYPHIRATPQPKPAAVAVSAADLKLPPLKKVGYVRGASDRVPEFLLQVGVPLDLLGPHELLEGDLGRYDAIVIGSRAYETDPVLGRANHRILDYAKAGGLVIVQYQQYPFIDGKFAPFALEIARPHDRVTDETAAATVLDPASPVFNAPNKIGPADWEGWVQERGLYFAHTWDPAFVPLLAFTDPDQPEMRGGLLVAPLGKGHYVYTGLSFFRQLPAGVPGAYRLFANLLALK